MISARFVRFCVIGGVSAACSLGLLYVLVDIAHLQYLLGFLITFAVVNCLSYLASRRFAFRTTTVTLGNGLLRYFGIMTFGLALNMAAMAVLVSGLHFWPVAAAALLSLLNAPMNFLLHGRLTFATSRRRPS